MDLKTCLSISDLQPPHLSKLFTFLKKIAAIFRRTKSISALYLFLNHLYFYSLTHPTPCIFWLLLIKYQVIGGNREMDQPYTTSQVSNITRQTKFSPISWHDTCDVIIQLYWECTNSTLPSVVLESILYFPKIWKPWSHFPLNIQNERLP